MIAGQLTTQYKTSKSGGKPLFCCPLPDWTHQSITITLGEDVY